MQTCCFFKNVWIVPFLPIPIYVFKACIKINFGVGKLLCVLSHTVFLCLFIYLQKFVSLQNHTEVYILKSTMQQCGLPGLRNQRKRLDTAKKITRESQYVKEKKRKRKKKKKKERKAKKTSLLGLANYYT